MPPFIEAGFGITAKTPALLQAVGRLPQSPSPPGPCLRLGEGWSFHVCPHGARIL